jgi:hypothetical protein
VSRAVREGALHEGMKAIIESIVIGGCIAADSVLTIEGLKTLWRNASPQQRNTLAEVCTLQTMTYLLSRQTGFPVSEVCVYAKLIDDLFDSDFADSVALAHCLYVQKLHDDAANDARTVSGTPGVSLWAITLAFKAAAVALGGADAPFALIPDRFPVSDSRSFANAGVPRTVVDSNLGGLVAYNVPIIMGATIAADHWSKMRDAGGYDF